MVSYFCSGDLRAASMSLATLMYYIDIRNKQNGAASSSSSASTPIPLCTERSTCHYDGKYRMEAAYAAIHSGITDAYLCLNRLRPRFHSVFGVYRLSAIS